MQIKAIHADNGGRRRTKRPEAIGRKASVADHYTTRQRPRGDGPFVDLIVWIQSNLDATGPAIGGHLRSAFRARQRLQPVQG